MADRVDRAAFRLFAKQHEDALDVDLAAAWTLDPELREFWRGQVTTVLEALLPDGDVA